TDYYADLTNIRSGLWTREQFLDNAAQDMQQVESAPEPWSEEDGSVATWIHEVFVNSSQLYYPKGALTGMLLDVALRDATDNGKLVVQGVVPGSAAEAAGLEPGDVLLKVGEVETRPDEDWGVKFRERYRGQAGAPLAIGVTRGGRALSLSTQVRERTVVSFT